MPAMRRPVLTLLAAALLLRTPISGSTTICARTFRTA